MKQQDEILQKLTRIEHLLEGQSPKPLTFEEARAYLGVSKGFLYSLTSRSLIPHFKPNGKRLYFLKTDLDAYLLRNRVKPTEEPQREAI